MRFPLLLTMGVAATTACSAFSSESEGRPGSTDGGGGEGASKIAGPAVDLAMGQQTPGGLVVDATNVYWLNQASAGKKGAVMKVAKSGGTAFVVAPDIAAPYAITSDATRLYFTDNDISSGGSYQNLYLQDKAGGAAQRLQLNANDQVFGCSYQGGNVFWTLQSNGGSVGFVDATSWTNTSVVSVATTLGAAKTVVADPTHVFVGVTGQIMIVNRSDHQAAIFAKVADVVKALVLDDTTVFWADATSVRALDKTMPLAEPRILADAQKGPSALAIDSAYVYWANADEGTIHSVAKTGGDIATLSTGESEPLGLAVDDSGLYWTNYADGRVRAIRR